MLHCSQSQFDGSYEFINVKRLGDQNRIMRAQLALYLTYLLSRSRADDDRNLRRRRVHPHLL